jgi:ferredoxin
MEYENASYFTTSMPKLTFHQQNRSLHVKEGTELCRLPYLDSTVPLKFGCRQGQCGTCVIKVIAGEENLSPQTKQEQATLSRLQLHENYRLACQCALKGDVVIDA